MSSTGPDISIVIPVYNEAGMLEDSAIELCDGLDALGWDYELIIAENGSSDGTKKIASELAASRERMHLFSIEEANYGRALKQGILGARGRLVICDEIDLCDLDFYQRAVPILNADDADMVVGSKSMAGAADDRPVFRRAATKVINGMLRVAVDFRGTDTHGLKAFWRERMTPVAERCIIERDLFASEFVVRSGREGFRVVEIPVRVAEKRRPAINLMRRVPGVLKNLARLTYVIRFKE